MYLYSRRTKVKDGGTASDTTFLLTSVLPKQAELRTGRETTGPYTRRIWTTSSKFSSILTKKQKLDILEPRSFNQCVSKR